jgi:hypothetical protein
VVSVEEGEEAQLELASRDVASYLPRREQLPHRRAPRAPRVPRDEGGEGGRAAEALDLRLGRGPLQLLLREVGREVKERAGGRRDGDPVADGHFVGLERHAVDVEPVARLERARHGDVDLAPLRGADLEERRGGPVAQDSAVRDEDGRHPYAVAAEDTVADRVDATVNRVKTPVAHPIVDRPPLQPELGELPTRHHTMLPGGERGGRSVQPTRTTFASNSGVKVACVEHAPIVPTKSCRRTTRPSHNRDKSAAFAMRTDVRRPPTPRLTNPPAG